MSKHIVVGGHKVLVISGLDPTQENQEAVHHPVKMLIALLCQELMVFNFSSYVVPVKEIVVIPIK